jgi:hypothetical protein
MQAERRIVAGGVVAVLLIATVGAWAARAFDFQYWTLSLLSLAIYFAVGAAAVRAGGSVGRATRLGTTIGLVDVTLGWALSAAIGPGRLEDSPFDGGTAIVLGGLVALSVYVGAAWLGALAGRRHSRSPAA